VTLELTQIAPQVKAMGQNIASQKSERQALIEQAKALLKKYSTAFDELDEKVAKAERVQEAARFNWVGAAPAGEALAESFAPPLPPPRATVIASDGSQIHPDRHGIALYYLINIGVIAYRHGSGQRPDTHTEPQLFYKDEDLFINERGLLIPSGVVNVKRDLAELEMLARLAPAYRSPALSEVEGGDAPLLTLIDGRLTLRVIDLPASQQEHYQRLYLDRLNQLQQHNALIAAYIERPHSSFILSLLHLASLEKQQISEESLRSAPFGSLSDSDLFDDLEPGQRTAIFNQRAKANAAYASEGHPIYFFHLNTGAVAQPNIVRVEIPGWIARNPEKLNALHAILLQQTAITGGYPYVLARAHELAIISAEEREALDAMMAVTLHHQGMRAEVSLKQANKNALGSREAFKL